MKVKQFGLSQTNPVTPLGFLKQPMGFTESLWAFEHIPGNALVSSCYCLLPLESLLSDAVLAQGANVKLLAITFTTM